MGRRAYVEHMKPPSPRKRLSLGHPAQPNRKPRRLRRKRSRRNLFHRINDRSCGCPECREVFKEMRATLRRKPRKNRKPKK